MRDSNDQKTDELVLDVDEPIKRRGRPPKNASGALSGQKRQQEYRSRRKRAQIDAIGQESDAPTNALLDLLHYNFAKLDKKPSDRTPHCAINRIMAELCSRYALGKFVPDERFLD